MVSWDGPRMLWDEGGGLHCSVSRPTGSHYVPFSMLDSWLNFFLLCFSYWKKSMENLGLILPSNSDALKIVSPLHKCWRQVFLLLSNLIVWGWISYWKRNFPLWSLVGQWTPRSYLHLPALGLQVYATTSSFFCGCSEFELRSSRSQSKRFTHWAASWAQCCFLKCIVCLWIFARRDRYVGSFLFRLNT